MTEISNSLVTCSNGHAQPGGGETCTLCGIDLAKNVIDTSSVRLHTKLKYLFIGVGDAGSRILLEYYSMFTKDSTDNFLFLDTSTNDIDSLTNTFQSIGQAGEDLQTSFKKIGKSIKGSARNWKRAESIVSEDKFLPEHL
ncbi:MAG: hypothetical protein CFH23_00100, partial [Alphaproteobacteria bacterium MarineAlpha6_Bin1]